MSARRIAELYALTHRGNRGDVEFYVDACRELGSVLELGCGFGRIHVPLLEQTRAEIFGVDIDEGMVELAEEATQALDAPLRSRSTLVRADMCTLKLDRRFDAVIIPYNTLYCLLDDGRASAALGVVAAHLHPGGTLLLDVYAISDSDWGRTQAPHDPEPLLIVHVGDEQIEVCESSVWHGESQRVDASYHHRIERRGQRSQHLEYTISQRYLAELELRTLVERAGFDPPQTWIGFGGQLVLRATLRSV